MKIKINDILNNKNIIKLKNFGKSNLLAKMLATSILWIVALIPLWLFLIIRLFITPIGFWQELALICTGCIALGWIQGPSIFIAIIITGIIIFDN